MENVSLGIHQLRGTFDLQTVEDLHALYTGCVEEREGLTDEVEPYVEFNDAQETISISNKQFIKTIHKQIGWPETGVYVAQVIRYIGDDMLLFDLSTVFVRTKEMKPVTENSRVWRPIYLCLRF